MRHPVAAALLLALVVPVVAFTGNGTVERSAAAVFVTEQVAEGLRIPWAIAFLPDGRALVSERAAGRLSLVDFVSGSVTPVSGGPTDVFVRENAGMLDVILHPSFEQNGLVYYSYTAGSGDLNTTVVERAYLEDARLVGRERLFDARPWFHNAIVYGGRLAIAGDYLYVTIGDRWDLRHLAQSPSSHLGKVLRLHIDGSVPSDNPWAGLPGALPEVWTLGNRNPQGLAIDPRDGSLWSHEHGPQGGDELNRIHGGRNYGWPEITHGTEYGGAPVGEGITARDGLEPPAHYWVPSIAPSDMIVYTADAVPGWRGNIFLGAMAGTHLSRLELADGRVVNEERLLDGRGWRVRAVAQGPDGLIYIGVDGGAIYRLVPAKDEQPAP